MSMIRDMMPGFELFQPATAQDAVALLERYGEDGWALAGGLDTFDWFKDRVKRPRAVIDLGGDRLAARRACGRAAAASRSAP